MSVASDLNILEVERGRIEHALAEVAAEAVAAFPPALRDPSGYALATSGKRLRPLLTVLAYAAATSDEEVPEPVYRLACALEIVHTYSLVHDDLPCMDDDDLRRGRPTVHRVFGTAHAALSGAALLPVAVEVLDREGERLGLSARHRGRLVAELMRASGSAGMVGGQLLDLEAERKSIGGPELEMIHRLKTGALLTCALRVGAIAGGADDDLCDRLTQYGAALGLAFQIADDLLDVEGESTDLGKTAGRDLALRKASYPALYGVDGARGMARERVAEAKDAIGPLGLHRLEALADFVIERRK